MNKLSSLIFGVVLTVLVSEHAVADQAPPPAAPLEQGAGVTESMKKQKKFLASMVEMVRSYGYRCDSISGVVPFAFSKGYNLWCNHSDYHYEIADKGGEWVVTID
ncbi:hypothetical protein [Aquirhabdus parva]|uniref:Uncharacterized protein n=1 Tax=Aquirhabdus parva TaxID=2283318 RepID=A0A345P7K6_9GAMM|nr:hypothetical protein [Aquirhabdus parva]AXI03265.1 hypothetical protein HYN46_10690 [Aquirhabdus parva]